MKSVLLWSLAPLLATLAACATPANDGRAPGSPAAAGESETDTVVRMLSGRSNLSGAALDRAVAEASAHPLGSRANPVRAHMPLGQRAYLARLRCSDLSAPSFERAGAAGLSSYGNVADVYEVVCEGAEPARTQIYLDMYHEGHVEREPVPGFGIAGARRTQ